MIINDLIFTIGSLIFLIALIPSLITEHKPEKTTSALTSSVLYIFTINYLAMGLYFSAIVVFATASAWLTLYFQARKGDKKIESNFST